jgi:hypothetical protein
VGLLSQDWYLLTSSPPVFNSGFEQDEFDNYAVDGFNELLIDSPLPYSVDLCNSDFTVVTPIKAIIQNTTSDSDVNSLERQILAPIGTLQTGKYIRYKNKIWLITGLVDDNKIYEKAVLKFCSNILKWQNSSSTIITRYAVVEKPFTSLDENNIISTSDKKYNLKIPLDSETQNLFVNKRFLLEKANGVPLAYVLTSFDGVTNAGILNIGLTQDVYNAETDNAELMIANYFTPTPPPTGTAQIAFTGSPTIYMGGSYKTLTGVFKDSEGIIIPDIIPVWTWTSLSSQTDKFDVPTPTGNTFKIRALFDTSLIGTKVKVELDDSLGLYHSEVILEVIDL